MKFFNLLLTGLVSVSLVSCDTKRNPYFGDEEAQFNVASINGTPTTKKTGVMKVAVKTELKFKACLKTLNGEALPSKLKFDVQAGTEIQSAVTDKDGCFEWIEEHGFEPGHFELNLSLKRTFISKNDYQGKRDVTIFWNIKNNEQKISSDVETKKPPVRTEVPANDGFAMPDARDTIQEREREKAENNTTPLLLLPEGNSQESLKTRLVLPSISLERVKLSQSSPFKVDQNLTLYSQHTYQFGAAPKFYINTVDNPDEEFNPPGGKYKITLVFMDDPRVDLEKLIVDLDSHSTIESIKQSQTSESQKLRLALQVLIDRKELEVAGNLNVEKKKQLLTKALIPLVHSTVQFIADKKAETNIEKYIDIQVKKLASLDIRSTVAVTIENVGQDQKKKLKGHGIGYVKNLLEPGNVTLIQTPIEADRLFTEYKKLSDQNEKFRPLDVYMQASVHALKDKALATINKADISTKDFYQGHFPTSYPFSKQLESYLNGTLDPVKETVFLKSLCYKMYFDQLKVLDTKSKYPTEERHKWAFRCEDSPKSSLDISVVDFVDNANGATVTKYGKSVVEEIKISRSFEKSLSQGTATGIKGESSISGGSEIGLSNIADIVNLFVPGLFGDFSAMALKTATSFLQHTSNNTKLSEKAVSKAFNGVIPNFKLNLAGSWSYAAEISTGQSQGGKVSRESSEGLQINMDTYKIKIDTRRCLIVNYPTAITDYLQKENNVKLHAGFIACSEKVTKPTYTERYYFVTQACSEGNGTTDCSSDEENKLRMILRGESMYNMFNALVENTDLNVLLSPMNADALEQKRMQWTTLMDALQTSQIFPGMLLPEKQ